MEANTLLRQARVARNWRQSDLAEQLGTTVTSIKRWERGSHQPSAYYRIKLCALFGMNVEELGLVPEDSSLQTIAEQAADIHREDLTSPTASFCLWSVPYSRNPFFTGREAILQLLYERLRQECSLALTQSCAISGLGGTGKTQTVLEYAYRHVHDYTAIFWIRAETAETILASFAALADLLDLPEKHEREQECMVAAVLRWLSCHQGWLFIFDNVEEPEVVREYVPASHSGSLLFTSRRRALGLSAQTMDLETMTLEEGMRFLLHRARVLSPTASIDQLVPEEREAARAIVAAMDGLPLALDQAGAYIEATRCGLSDYVHLLQASPQHLLAEREAHADHPLSVSATFTLAFQRLTQQNVAAAEMLAACAFLAPEAIPETLFLEGADRLGPACEGLAASPLAFQAALKALLAYSLLQRDATTRQLSVHRLVQVVLRGSLPGHIQDTWISRLIHHLDALFPGESHAMECWTWCEQVAEHVVILLRLAQHTADPLEVASLSLKLATYFQQRGRYLEAEHYHQQAVDLRERMLGADHPELIDPLIGLAEATWSRCAYTRAQVHAQRVIALLERTQGPHAVALARPLNFLAQIAREQGRLGEAEGLFGRSLAIWATTRERENAGLEPLPPLGACPDGEAPEMQALLQQVFALWEPEPRRHHDPIGLALTGLSQVYQQQHRDREAEAILLPLLRIGQLALGDRHPLHTYPRMVLAEAYRTQGRLAEAEECYQWSLAIREEAWGFSHFRTKETRAAYAALLRAMDREDEAAEPA